MKYYSNVTTKGGENFELSKIIIRVTYKSRGE